MRTRLDSLLDKSEPLATFHDASLLSVRVDFQAGTLIADFSLCVGGPDEPDEASRERRRNGRLSLAGLRHWSIESKVERKKLDSPLWLTSDGPLDEGPTEIARTLAASLPATGFAWWLYFNDLKAFAYCASDHAAFEWL